MPRISKTKAAAHPAHEEPLKGDWEEHGHQPFQRAEHMEKRVGMVMGIIAVGIALAMAARLLAPYFGFNF